MARLRRALAGLAVALAPLTTLAAPAFVAPAAALTAEVGFTADALPTWQTNGVAWSVTQAEGVVYVGGTFSAVRPAGAAAGTSELAATNFVALDAATGNPTGCQLAFAGASSSVRALAVSPDQQTLYAAGLFGTVNGMGVQNFAAIDLTTCTPISTFRPQVAGWVRGVTVAPDGTIYLAGEFTTVDGQPRQRFAAFDATGALRPWAPAADLPGYTVAITPDGQKAAIGGAFNTVNGSDSHALAIVDTADGALVRGYPGFSFAPSTSTVKSLVADSTGIYAGNEGTGFEAFDGRSALDPISFAVRWQDYCFGATQSVLVDRNNVYGASHAHDCARMGGFPNGRRQHLTVESINDPRLKVWWPDTDDGIGEGIGPRALTIAPTLTNRYLWAVGEFTTVNGAPQQGLMRLAEGPDTGNPPAPTGFSASTAVAGQITLRWLTSTDRDDENLTYRVYKGSSTTPLATLNGSSDWWRRPQLSVLDTNVVNGSFYTYKVTATDSAGNVSAAPTLGVRPSATSSQYASTVLADGPSLYWRYNETGSPLNLADESPNGNGALLVGGRTAAVAPAAINNDPSTAMTFNGSTGYAYEAQPEQAPSTYTVETWFQTTSVTGGKLVGFGNNTSRLSVKNYDRHIYMRNDGRLVFGASSTTSTLASTAAYNDGQWHHVAATQGPAGMALYVDGNRVATNAVTANTPYQGYWHVGGDQLSGWPGTRTSNFFNGQLDETAVYRTALPASTIAAHYTASGRTVADVTAPTAPTGLTAAVAGSDVSLSWTASTDDTGVTGYAVHRSSTTGFTPSTTTKVADVTTTSYTDTARPAGTWYYRVVAVDAAGNASAGSNQATATVGSPADTTAPAAPAGLTATVTGSNVGLSWTASTDNVGVTGYAVHRSSTTGFTPSATTKVADVTSTSYTDTARPAGTWYYRVVAVDAAGNASAGSNQATATVAGSSDTTAPSAPTALTTTVTGSNVALKWTASTDNVGVTGYAVHRSSTTGFTPSTTTKVADVTTTSYTDTARPAGTWYYRVVALDAAGNASAGSNQATAVVPSTVTQVLAPTADTYVSISAPTTNYGTSASMAASSTNVITFVRFALPAAPVGKVLKTATLRTQTTSIASAGSATGHPVTLGPTAWTETGLTYNNRPAAPSPTTTFGTITGATTASKVTNTALTAATVAKYAGRDLNLNIRDAGSDAIWLWSRQAATTQRPQLTLVYGAP